jgi:hypothetical protein
MRKKTIDIPIYGVKLTIILDDDFSYVENIYNLKPINGRAVTITNPNINRQVIVAFIDKKYVSSIVHEVVHVKNYICLWCGAELDMENDEPEAYLTGYLFEQIYEFINK